MEKNIHPKWRIYWSFIWSTHYPSNACELHMGWDSFDLPFFFSFILFSFLFHLDRSTIDKPITFCTVKFTYKADGHYMVEATLVHLRNKFAYEAWKASSGRSNGGSFGEQGSESTGTSDWWTTHKVLAHMSYHWLIFWSSFGHFSYVGVVVLPEFHLPTVVGVYLDHLQILISNFHLMINYSERDLYRRTRRRKIRLSS